MDNFSDVSQKATEIFKVCDPEFKGFITKRDMQRLRGDTLVGLTPEQLDQVFELLDRDRNGYLTIDELKVGFDSFLGSGDAVNNNKVIRKDNRLIDDDTFKEADEDEDHNFQELLRSLGAQNLFQNEEYIKSLWVHFRQDDVTLMQHFECFLKKVVKELQSTQKENSALENALKNRSSLHDKEIRKLYEEMEHMIKNEREQITSEERSRERRKRDELEGELHQKDKELQQLLERHAQMERELKQINSIESETKMENAQLLQERDLMEQRLDCSERLLLEAQSNLDSIRFKELDSRRERAKAAMRVSEGIALEREGLVKQLDILRNVNRELVDEQDSRFIADNNGGNDQPLSSELQDNCSDEVLEHLTGFSTENPIAHQNRYSRRSGSVMSDYFNSNKTSSHSGTDDCEVDDSFFQSSFYNSPSRSSELPETSCSEYEEPNLRIKPQFRTRRLANLGLLRCKDTSIEESTTGEDDAFSEHMNTDQQNFKGEWKVKRRIYSDSDGETQCSENSTGNPERLYKIVFIGDSGVGKSSFINRFCNEDFRTSFSATIGVDFQVKSVTLDGHVVALQLWDTAGQERFRSITKQYYRKADGVIIMFDVTSEGSFQNVRSWMNDVRVGADEHTVLLLVGNKIDQSLEQGYRVVKTCDGERQAQEFGSLYCETSAKTGEGVQESILAMSALLQEREDEVMEKALRLQEQKKKKKCC